MMQIFFDFLKALPMKKYFKKYFLDPKPNFPLLERSEEAQIISSHF